MDDSWPCWTPSAALRAPEAERGLGRKMRAGLHMLSSEVPESLRRETNLVNTGEQLKLIILVRSLAENSRVWEKI